MKWTEIELYGPDRTAGKIKLPELMVKHTEWFVDNALMATDGVITELRILAFQYVDTAGAVDWAGFATCWAGIETYEHRERKRIHSCDGGYTRFQYHDMPLPSPGLGTTDITE